MPTPDQYDTLRTVILERCRYRYRQYVSSYAADHITATATPGNGFAAAADVIAMDFIADVLTEKLPPKRVTTTVTSSRHVRHEGHLSHEVARFATPWDHLKARWWDRWWMWVLRDLGLIRPARAQIIVYRLGYADDVPVRCTHNVAVDISTAWTYPKERLRRPELGPPVLGAYAVPTATDHEVRNPEVDR